MREPIENNSIHPPQLHATLIHRTQDVGYYTSEWPEPVKPLRLHVPIRLLSPESPLRLQIYSQAYPRWICRISNPIVGTPGRGDFSGVLPVSVMASRCDVFFSAIVSIQMQAAVGFSFTFGSFLETTVPKNPLTEVHQVLVFYRRILRGVSQGE